jgi:peroxiredoxin Q/BCP
MTHLQAGDPAPDFTALNQNGDTVRLSDFKGHKLVLYFYPKDNTPGCTSQACNLRDNYQALLAAGYRILGISPDSAKRHQNFINKFDLPFDLLVDTDLEMIKAYNVWGPKKFMGREYDGLHRTTFIIDENGVISEVITKVKTKEHTAQIMG